MFYLSGTRKRNLGVRSLVFWSLVLRTSSLVRSIHFFFFFFFFFVQFRWKNFPCLISLKRLIRLRIGAHGRRRWGARDPERAAGNKSIVSGNKSTVSGNKSIVPGNKSIGILPVYGIRNFQFSAITS